MKPLFVSLEEVVILLSISTTSLQRMVRSGEFPAPRKISPRRVAWLVREVEEWAESRPISDLPPPVNAGKRSSASNRCSDNGNPEKKFGDMGTTGEIDRKPA